MIAFNAQQPIAQKWYAPTTETMDSGAPTLSYGGAMQRLYSVFPKGSPGYGLLLLRLVLGAYLISTGIPMVRNLASTTELMTVGAALGVWWVICGLLVGIGLLTPVVQTAVAAAHVCLLVYQLWAHAEWLGGFASGWSVQLSVVIAASLALLGPGAYSVDAYLFGRQEIDIPRLTRNSLES